MVVNAQQQQSEKSSLAFVGASLIAGIVTSPQLDFQAAEKANFSFSITVVFHLLAIAVGTLALGLAKFFRRQLLLKLLGGVETLQSIGQTSLRWRRIAGHSECLVLLLN